MGSLLCSPNSVRLNDIIIRVVADIALTILAVDITHFPSYIGFWLLGRMYLAMYKYIQYEVHTCN